MTLCNATWSPLHDAIVWVLSHKIKGIADIHLLHYGPASLQDGPSVSRYSTPITSERRVNAPERLELSAQTYSNVTSLALDDRATFTEKVQVNVSSSLIFSPRPPVPGDHKGKQRAQRAFVHNACFPKKTAHLPLSIFCIGSSSRKPAEMIALQCKLPGHLCIAK